jgi:hypothetical protein
VKIAQSPTLYLKSDGTVVPDLASAASCSITAESELNCGAGVIGTGTISDMALMKGTVDEDDIPDITKGWSVGDDKNLVWKSTQFMHKDVKQAEWAVMTDDSKTLYAQLGCKHNFHPDNMVPATIAVVFK